MMPSKTERIEARLSAEEKNLIAQAAALEGKSLSEFLVSSANNAAKQAMQENEILSLSAKDREIFLNALLGDIAPSPRLKKAAKEYLEDRKRAE